MSALRKMLAAQDDTALVALASAGLLRRAQAAQDAVLLSETEDMALLSVEGYEVVLDKGGPTKARCTCPATGICKHVLVAILRLRASLPLQGGPSAKAEITGLTLAEIEEFAGADWPQALRIAALSVKARISEDDSSCLVEMAAAPSPVTFVAGSGLNKALFDGPEGRRKRFIAAAALTLGGHALPEVAEAIGAVDATLLHDAADVVRRAMVHGLRGDAALAQDRLFDIAISARADAAPRLAALLRVAAVLAGRLSARDPNTDPTDFLTTLAECHALIRALTKAPSDTALTGQPRRDYQMAPPMDVVILGAMIWQAPSGARGLTLHGWDGTRFVATGPARAAGADPTFSAKAAYRQSWWRGLSPQRMTGQRLHLSAPLLSVDGLLSQQSEGAEGGEPLTEQDLPFYDRVEDAIAELHARLGIGLRASTRPQPILLRFARIASPRFDNLAQTHLLDIADAEGGSLPLILPDEPCGTALYDLQNRVMGGLLEVVTGSEGLELRLTSVYLSDPLEVWNVTLDPAPKRPEPTGVMGRLRAQFRAKPRPVVPPVMTNRVAALADQALQALCDSFDTVPDSAKFHTFARQFEALGLDRIAGQFNSAALPESEAVLGLAWELTLVRRAALLSTPA